MRKNVASQVIGAQMITAADGTAFTGSVTVLVTGDGGTQTTGTVGSGACTHEGNGFHTYAPAQAETNYDHIGFTFTGTGAIPATVQVYPTYPQTGDNYARIGAPAGASVSADVAAIKAVDDAIKTKTDFLPSATAGAAGGVFIAGTNAATTVTTALTTTFTGNLTGSVASVTGAVGSVTGSVGSVVGLTAATVHSDLDDIQARLPAALVSGRMDVSVGAIAADAITAAATAADFGTEIGTAVWATAARTLTALDEDNTTLDLDATIRAAVGLASANLDTQLADLPTNAELATALGIADDAVLAAIAALNDLSAADVANAVWDEDLGLHTDSDTAGALLAEAAMGSALTAADIADAVWEEAIADHSGTSGSTAEALAAAGSAGDPWITALPGAYSAGQAGYIVGTNLNATVSSRATQTSVDDLPTNAELATALAAADDAVLAAIPTAIENADALLNRDMAAVSDTESRSPLNAFRFIRNGFSTSGATLTVLKEDDTTPAYTRTLTTDPAAEPIVGVD